MSDQKKLIDMYYAGEISVDEYIKAILESEEGDRNRREIEKRVNEYLNK